MKQFFEKAATLMGVPPPPATPLWLARLFAGRILCETLTRNITAETLTLNETRFEFNYRTFSEGLPPPSTNSATGQGRTAFRLIEPDRQPILLLSLVVLCLVAMVSVNAVDFPASAAQLMRLSGGCHCLICAFTITRETFFNFSMSWAPWDAQSAYATTGRLTW